MTHTTSAPSGRAWSAAACVLAGGLLAGTFDISYAITFWAIKANVPPERVLQSVAAGILGRTAARAGGLPTAALGLVLHYSIATTMSLVYFLASRRLVALTRRPVLWGALYGIGCYATMTYVVVPLSNARGGGSKDPLWISLSILVHMFLIGLPIALSAARAESASAAALDVRAEAPAS